MAASTNNARSAAPRQQTPFDLPGYTLPLNYKPSNGRPSRRDTMFPNSLDYQDIQDGYIGRLKTLREITMMQIMNAITDKPEWDRKIFDEENHLQMVERSP
ncbi:hypothetical protein VTN96DRAFT_5055 [Rasamsonia emersonii]